MRPLSVFFALCVGAVILCSCHKSSNSSAPYISNITKSRHWAGFFQKSLASPVGGSSGTAAFGINVTDTLFAISATGNTINISFIGFPLKYISTDLTAQTVTYDSSINGSPNATLVYYYALDSMTISYYNVVGSEWGYDDPYIVNYGLHTHN